MDQNDPTRATLDAGVKDIIRDLESSTTERTMALMAQARGSRLLAFREGVLELRSRIREYETRLIDLHLDLGVLDAVAIGDRIVNEIKGALPSIVGSLAATFRGAERAGARRDGQLLTAEIVAAASSAKERALVAAELRRRKRVGSERAGGEAVAPANPLSSLPAADQGQDTSSREWKEWDIFISHASEDKASFVAPLVRELERIGLRVWYDEHTLKLGDSLREEIDRGLAQSRFGVVVLSHAFFARQWPRRELDGLVQREIAGEKVILPIWHNVCHDDVKEFSVTLAGKVAVQSARGMSVVVGEILKAVARPISPATSDNDTTGGAIAAEKFGHRLRANFQGPCQLRKGKSIEIHRFIGPSGPSGTLRILRMVDLDEEITYTSAVFNLMMTVQPADAVFRGRIAGAIHQEPALVEFDIEMTDEEYAKFAPHAEPQLSPFVR